MEIEDDRVLQISGQKNVEKEDKNDTWHWVERSSGQFMMRFRLLENVKIDQVKASMKIGVITDTVPKVEVKKPDVKAIDIVELNINCEAPLHRHNAKPPWILYDAEAMAHQP
ncbi:hypothetical protein Gohar_015161 [Gossypium harknessii]|uniref:SHSP domain-containing protein n=1 Tax=Gossypium harknessii TaxID=34285 RepID=A0A7J9FZE9_9ROSI|nr:hypothetical protein [Gossypium harknessii]